MRRETSIFLLGCLLFCALLAAGTSAASAGPSTGRNHALIIGCSQYDFWPALPGPARDAAALYELLSADYGFAPEDMVLLTDQSEEKPTREVITRHLERLLRGLKENDNLLVFFSGRSARDENGDSYWIPKNGKKNARTNWLRHEDLVAEYFANPAFSAKNVAILTDAPFSARLLAEKPNLLSSDDLRFTEKLLDKAQRRSREVVAAAEAGEEAGGGALSRFNRDLLKALKDNELAISDLETLLFPISDFFKDRKEDGPYLRGRLDTPMDGGGQLVLAKADLMPRVNIRSVAVSPESPVAGQEVAFTVTTEAPAREVILKIGGENLPLVGGPDSWTLIRRLEVPRDEPFSVSAVNDYARAGEAYHGLLTVKKPQGPPVDVESLALSPNPAGPGEDVTFTVQTASEASAVTLTVGGRALSMEGGGKDWKAVASFSEAGDLAVSARAFNADGVPGIEKSSRLSVLAGLVRITSLSVSPSSGDSGALFTFKVTTDAPAQEVFLLVDGESQAMEGAGVDWKLSRRMTGSGSKTVTAVAKNSSGRESEPGEVRLRLARPLAPPSVKSVAVWPRPATAREPFTMEAVTDAPARRVTLSMDGQNYSMQGSGTRFRYEMAFPDPGSFPYTVSAEDAAGKAGRAYTGVLKVEARQPRIANLERATAVPETADVGQPVRFTAYTTAPADKVTITIEGVKHDMKSDRGTMWTLLLPFKNYGPKTFQVRVENSDGTTSREISGGVLVRAPLITIVSSFLEPPTIRAGQEVIVTATTDYPAAAVDIWLGDRSDSMEAIDGSGKKWRYVTVFPDPMPDDYRITLKGRNQEGRYGKALYWNFAQ